MGPSGAGSRACKVPAGGAAPRCAPADDTEGVRMSHVEEHVEVNVPICTICTACNQWTRFGPFPAFTGARRDEV
ncbi:hypothetical protein EES37_32285 [Streptomyces sp. ADI91-18]|nr:hypothetical protein EES37_32285 [Streptomyces sp. ADI91-18]